MEREVGGGIGMGNTCKPMAVSFQCMTKSTRNKNIYINKIKKLKKKKKKEKKKKFFPGSGCLRYSGQITVQPLSPR